MLKIGLLTGDCDVPGLNAMIQGILLKAREARVQCIGIKKGWSGFMKNITCPLQVSGLDDLHVRGGTLLHASRYNPLRTILNNATVRVNYELKKKIAMDMHSRFKELGIDALIIMGDDNSMSLASLMAEHANARVIAIPITMTTTLHDQDFTVGFWSATQMASDIIDNLKITARSHQAIFVIEISGKYAGLVTLYCGISSGADIMLIPEHPFDLERDIVKVLKKRMERGHASHVILCSKDARPSEESLMRDFKTLSHEMIEKIAQHSFMGSKLSQSGVSELLINELKLRKDVKKHVTKSGSKFEFNLIKLGPIIKAGAPRALDRILGLRIGLTAMKLVLRGEFGMLVSLINDEVKAFPLNTGVKKSLLRENEDLIEIKELLTRVKHESKRRFATIAKKKHVPP